MAICFICRTREASSIVEPFSEKICDQCSRQYQDANFKSQSLNAPPKNPDQTAYVIIQPPGRVIRINSVVYAFERESDAGRVLARLRQDHPAAKTWTVQKTMAMKIYEWAIASKCGLISVKELLPGWDKFLFPPQQWFNLKKTPDEIAALQARRTPEAKSKIKAQRQKYREARAKRLGHF